MRRTALAAASLWLGFTASGAAAQEIGLASGLDGYDESYTWENETLSFGVSGGWLTGQSHEFAHYPSGEKLSELVWDIGLNIPCNYTWTM
jgi:hypothetical protein